MNNRCTIFDIYYAILYISRMKYSWDLVRTFDAVAKSGSLLAAGRALGLSQPTVGRHIDQLEEALQVALFVRSRDGMALTDAGADLIAASGEMVRTSEAFQRRASGLDKEISGVVRISVNDILGVHVLPRLLVDFMEARPEIEIELDISNATANLSRRDADLALRMYQPVQTDLIAQKVTDIPIGFYAHRSYLKRHPRPINLKDLLTHRFIGFDRETLHIDAARQLGLQLTASDFCFRCDNIVSQIEGVRAGLGIGVLHRGLAAKMNGVEQLLADICLPSLELWIACHSEVRSNMRVRLVFDFLAERLRTPYEYADYI